MTRAEIVAAAVAGYGKESATVIGARLGITRNAVIGLWGRARKAGRAPEQRLRIYDRIWAALLAAGPDGCTVDHLADVVYGAERPQAWKASLRCQVQRAGSVHGSDELVLRSVVDPSGVAYVVGKPVPEPAVEAAQPMAAPAVVKRAPAPARAISRPSLPRVTPQPSIVLQDLSGAARAVFEAGRPGFTCRWPERDPRDDEFRFCGKAVEIPVAVGKDGQSRPQVYCEDCRKLAYQPKERFRPPVLGHAAFTAPRQVKAGAVRFGRSA